MHALRGAFCAHYPSAIEFARPEPHPSRQGARCVCAVGAGTADRRHAIACPRSTSCCPIRFRARARCCARCRISGSRKTAHLLPNHLTGKSVAGVLPAGIDADLYTRRSVVAKRLQAGAGRGDRARLPDRLGLEGLSSDRLAVRHHLPAGLRQAEKLPQPIFTPSTKAAAGAHDENIGFDRVVAAIGARSRRAGARCNA